MTKYGVSYATVTRALQELRSAGLIERQWGKGTFVARQSANIRSIALTFDGAVQITHPQMVRVIRGIGQALENHPSLTLQIYPLAGGRIFSQSSDPLFTRMLKERTLAGVICCSAHSPEDMRHLHRLGIPTVTVLNSYPRSGISCVMPDAGDCARQLISFLSGLGHRQIGFVGGPVTQKTTQFVRASTIFFDAFLGELRGRGLPNSKDLTAYSDYSWKGVEPIMRKWLAMENRPTAVAIYDDMIALEVIRLAERSGLRVPEDMSVVGAGDFIEASTLTTIILPYEEIGRMSVQLLTELIAGHHPADSCVPGKLIVRQTTGPAPKSVIPAKVVD